MRLTSTTSVQELAAIFDTLQARASAEMAAEGLDAASVTYQHSLDMRYRGQSYEISVPVSGIQVFGYSGIQDPAKTGSQLTSSDPEHLNTRTPEYLDTRIPEYPPFVADFHARHAALYGRANPDQPTEIVQVRLRAIGATAKPAGFGQTSEAGPQPSPIAVEPVASESGRTHQSIDAQSWGKTTR